MPGGADVGDLMLQPVVQYIYIYYANMVVIHMYINNGDQPLYVDIIYICLNIHVAKLVYNSNNSNNYGLW